MQIRVLVQDDDVELVFYLEEEPTKHIVGAI